MASIFRLARGDIPGLEVVFVTLSSKVALPAACEYIVSGADFSPVSSRRSPQAALKFSYRSDRVTRY